STFLMVCAVGALANAADPEDQIYEKSPDERFGFRDSFAGAAKTEQSEMSDPMAIEVVEISSKRVVLPSPKEALTPIHLRREPHWSNDSKHIALSFQTGPRTWTAMLYEWAGKESAEVSWTREASRQRLCEALAAEIGDATKILGASGYGYVIDKGWAEARLADEQPESFYLVKDVEEGQQPFRLYALERFAVVGEKGDDYVVEDGCEHKGRIP